MRMCSRVQDSLSLSVCTLARVPTDVREHTLNSPKTASASRATLFSPSETSFSSFLSKKMRWPHATCPYWQRRTGADSPTGVCACTREQVNGSTFPDRVLLLVRAPSVTLPVLCRSYGACKPLSKREIAAPVLALACAPEARERKDCEKERVGGSVGT